MDSNFFQNNTGRRKPGKDALAVQDRLLELFVDMARSRSEEQVLKTSLQATLDITTELTGAEKGSLFLLDDHGVVVDSILTRKDTTPGQRESLIGQVLEEGLAGWVSRNREIGLISDTRNDDRWVTLPNQPYSVLSALAVPIIARDRELLAILTLMHSRAGHFGQTSARLMQTTADQIALVLENVKLYAKLEDSYNDLDKLKTALDNELEKGKKIQESFLPDALLQPRGWEICAYFHPALQVSGDFYDVFPLSRNTLGIVIGDVCDKGVSAALFMALFRSLIRVFSRYGSSWEPDSAIDDSTDLDPVEALNAVSLTNDYIELNHGREGMFCTLFFGVLDPEAGVLYYINAGHESPFIVNARGVKTRLPATGTAVGLMPGSKFNHEKIIIEPGDILIGYTDGVSEAQDPDGALFTQKRMISLLNQPVTSASHLMEHIRTHLFAHIDQAPQSDDITMFCIGRTAPHL